MEFFLKEVKVYNDRLHNTGNHINCTYLADDDIIIDIHYLRTYTYETISFSIESPTRNFKSSFANITSCYSLPQKIISYHPILLHGLEQIEELLVEYKDWFNVRVTDIPKKQVLRACELQISSNLLLSNISPIRQLAEACYKWR